MNYDAAGVASQLIGNLEQAWANLAAPEAA